MKSSTFFLLCLLFSAQLFSQNNKKPDRSTINLLTQDLDYWYKWIGVPHTSVTGLPEGTPKGDGMNGIPLGLNDPKEVFKVITLDGEQVIRVSGEIYGGLTTKIEYENYHFHLQYKWGVKKWAPRLNMPRDMGIMFHLTGTNEDAFWSVFMMGIECQICEKSSGDLFLVPNKSFTIRPVADVRVGSDKKWDANASIQKVGGYDNKLTNLGRSEYFESDSTGWTTMDVYTVGSSAVYLVNGHVVMAFQNAGLQQADRTITPLGKGKIQLQSEGAEAYYKDITIQPISVIPAEIKKAAGL
jgi:hypothetical protein